MLLAPSIDTLVANLIPHNDIPSSRSPQIHTPDPLSQRGADIDLAPPLDGTDLELVQDRAKSLPA